MYLVDTQIGVRTVGERDGTGGAGELFHGEKVVEVAEAKTAGVSGGDGYAEETHGTEFRPEVLFVREG